MTDAPGRLGAALADRYRIERELGAGGMATVYLAHDVRHDRRVALKVLRPELSAILGAERFLHEIKTTANLQHPHILSLFDSGEADGTVYYVMPYVEGESLRDRLNRETQLPVDDAVRIAKEVADALEYAHQHGIVHRDIKPENILLHGGHAMVADFGIALAAARSDGGSRMTETGMSLGTPHYMSPEQAMGQREITARADIYALGCVLYEMLSGEPPFTGPTAQAIVARVMIEEPRSLTMHRRSIPPHVEAVVRKALEKLPADRFGSAAQMGTALGDAGFATTATMAHAAPMRDRFRAVWRPLAIGASLAAIGLLVALLAMLNRSPAAPVARFRMLLDSTELLFFTGQANPPRLALSPDGNELVYVGVSGRSGSATIGNLGSAILGSGSSGITIAGTVSGLNVLIHRRFSELEARTLPGTEGAWAPQFSDAGDRIAFVANSNGRLVARVIALSGGPAVTVADSGVGSSVSWGPDEYLYYVHASEPEVYRVSSGSAPERVCRLPDTEGIQYDWPDVLPGGRGIILTMTGSVAAAEARGAPSVQVFDLPGCVSRATIGGVFARYSSTGHIVYATADASLLAVPFDAGALRVTGRPVALFEGLDVRNQGIADLALSRAGTMAYTTSSTNAPETVSWVTRAGEAARVDPAWTRDWEFEGLELSPDGRRVATVIETGNRGDVWIKQLDRGPLTRLTFTGDYNGAPAWSPDGRFITYVSVKPNGSEIRRTAADGSGGDTLLLSLNRAVHFTEWSRDGSLMLISAGGRSDDILAFEPGLGSAPRPLLEEPFDEFLPSLSPDGRWLAYNTSESGRNEVYLRPFPDTRTGKWQLSTEGGIEPVWGPGGRELFFRTIDRRSIVRVDLSRGPDAATRSVVTRLPAADDFESNPRNRLFDVAPDGRFMMIQRSNATDVSGDLIVVLNWFTELRSLREQR